MKKTVTDINGIRYTLGEEIGSGGQGKVFRCANDGRRAIKIFDSSNTQIESIRRLRLDNEIFIVPEIPLRENNGYVMEFLEEGMQSLESVFWKPLKDHDFSAEWFAETGGLEKRYKVLAKIADALHYLHSRGLIYHDISLKNIFVSASPLNSAVCFIDCDNITYDTDAPHQMIGTPGFIPPEFYSKKHYGSLSEVFSFAILAFMILRTAHPFRGKFYQENSPSVFEEKYKSGALPYIDDLQDPSNHMPSLFSEENVFSQRLSEMFRSVFGEGLHNPLSRQSIAIWSNVFHTLQVRLIKCDNCGNHYLHSQKGCPWCKKKEESCLILNIVVRDEWIEKYISDFYDQIGRDFPPNQEKKHKMEIRNVSTVAKSVRMKKRNASIPFSAGQIKVLDFRELLGIPEDQSLEIKYTGKTLSLDNKTEFSIREHNSSKTILPGRKSRIPLPNSGEAAQWTMLFTEDRSVVLHFKLQ